MKFVKKSIGKRALHKMKYDSRVNERLMQTTEEKVDSSKALDASLVDTESNGTTLKEQDTSNRSGNDSHADDADIRPISDEEPMAEVQMTADDNVSATGQQHTEQPEFINEGEVDQNAEHVIDILKDIIPSTTKVKSEPLNGSNADITNQCESKQALNVSAGTLLSTGTSFNPTEERTRSLVAEMKRLIISGKLGLQGNFDLMIS
ncbi:hypothetical protein Tco_1070729 [Tanacetum coccineum]|uniref:Uncharacterized protein n=1 Tax=Tanacetum coccineum TaxID=301880 RepID=A0ABQ5HMA0_9ASTR